MSKEVSEGASGRENKNDSASRNLENVNSRLALAHRNAKGESRRSFLTGVSALAAVAAGSMSLVPLAATAEARNDGDSSGQRSRESFDQRADVAQQERAVPTPVQLTNGDEARYSNFIGNFTKGLQHGPTGEVERGAYLALLEAIEEGTFEAFERVPLGGTVKLVNPLAGEAFDLEGTDSHKFAIAASPAVASQVRADEMVELYWMALLRDVNFSEYATNPIAQAAAKELSSLRGFQGPKQGGQVTAETLFRGFTADDLIGPYVSQLFLTPFSYGQFALNGQVSVYQANVDYMTTQAEWLACQNGEAPFAVNQMDPVPRYYRNGRDLATYVHVDHICEAFYNAMLRLYEAGAPPNPGNPYNERKKQSSFGTFGEPHFLTMHGEMALRALKAVWYQKWFVHRTLRPEAYGGLAHMTKTGQASYPLHADVLSSQALEQTFAKYGTYFLTCAFPEGCPQHPSYAQAHGAVSGACATVLKAAFDGSVQYNTLAKGEVQVTSEDGSSLEAYTGSDASEITVNGEINKLASNIAIARNFAGVHWRTDYVYGLLLGEAVALSVLRDQRNTYAGENFAGFQIKKLDGTMVTV